MKNNQITDEEIRLEIERCIPDIRNFVGNQLRTDKWDDVEDVIQETILRAYEYRLTFKGKSNIKTWLYRIAWTRCANYIEKRKTVRKYSEMSINLRLRARQRAALGSFKARTFLDSRNGEFDIENAVMKLDPDKQEILKRLVGGQTLRQISRELGLTFLRLKEILEESRAELSVTLERV